MEVPTNGINPESTGPSMSWEMAVPRFTIFNTPGVGFLMRAIGFLYMRIVGWRPSGAPPDLPKFVIIGAPHTSNWDLPLLIAIASHFRLDVRWMGKDSLFKGVLGPIMRFLGGISVDRKRGNSVVEQTIEHFSRQAVLKIVVAPEGTRGNAGRWKAGFYNIAVGANVPVACSYIDYRTKRGGFGPTFWLTGDREADMARFAEFYGAMRGLYPDQTSPVRL